jgi:beta-carotene ketolase (CrtW type)
LVLSWLATLLIFVSLDCRHLPWWGLSAAVLVRTELQTGLFIVAHDAMHGALWPGERPHNDRLGAVVLLLYAALPYQRCKTNHQRHHQATASELDPDFPSGLTGGVLGWYRQFMAGYLTPAQMVGLVAGWALLAACFTSVTQAAWLNVLLFATLPLLLSSLQLFVVGTYLPHRNQREPVGRLHADSLDLPPWLSLVACFHFGYHCEHHDHPELPWFALPGARSSARALALPGPSR